MSCRGAACCKAHPSSSRATPSGEGARQGGWQFSMTRPRISPLCGKRCCSRRRQVYIIGWDIHSLTRFVGPSGQADDGYPEELGAFLKALLKAKPELRINILSWNFPALYAAEREWNSAAKFTSEAPDRLCFCFDSSLPLGSAQHQKIVVIDGALAFVGGLDLTIRRWDTSAHEAHHPLRDRSRRQALSAVSRRAVHGGWRSSRQSDGSGGEQVARRRLHGRNDQRRSPASAGRPRCRCNRGE